MHGQVVPAKMCLWK
uniref:Uncharacterized protein n=1 Tax=Anguilla anguilla TaxID=7936 RepID=A0A0E9SQE3_ANGAN